MLSNLNVDRFLADKPLALTLAGLEELRGHIIGRLALFDAGPRAFVEMVAAERNAPRPGRPRRGATGVIQIRGAISQHKADDLSALLFGGASTEAISEQLREFLNDDDVSSILLDIDSPGGTTFGVAELAAEIREARQRKPIVAVANSVAASAAYWLGAQADQFYASPGAIVGSIGVYGVHQDISKFADNAGVKTTLISAGKYKTAGNQFEPLPDDVRERMQSRVDEAYDMFVRDVAKGRGVPEATVREGYGEGDIVTARQAKALGMIDGIYTYEQSVARAATIRTRQAAEPLGSAASIDDPEPPAEAEPVGPVDDVDGQQRLALMRYRAHRREMAARGVA